jgi:hypothetical protein
MTVPVYVTTNEEHFSYRSRLLLVGYVTTGVLVSFCLSIGLYALVKNGIAHNNGFSGMVSVTRNMELDRMFEGYSTGTLSLASSLQSVRLRMGVVSAEGANGEGVGHVAFGSEGEVTSMRKGGTYY